MIATVEFYRRHDVIARLAATGRKVIEGLRSAAVHHRVSEHLLPATDFDCRPVLRFQGPDGQLSQGYRTLFIQEMLARGVFMPWICPSFRHSEEDLGRTFDAFDGACKVYAQAIDAGGVDRFLHGPPAKPVLRRRN